jgi:phosphatidylinositol 4-kinase A
LSNFGAEHNAVFQTAR